MRFYGLVAIAFVTAFVAVSWASRGFPVMGDTQPPQSIAERGKQVMMGLLAVENYKRKPCDPARRDEAIKAIKAYMNMRLASWFPSKAELDQAIFEVSHFSALPQEETRKLLYEPPSPCR